ncbi:MAG TPA: hypothetical protein VGM10_00470 [Actinocrinis sp.]|jgi:hypothetical protein
MSGIDDEDRPFHGAGYEDTGFDDTGIGGVGAGGAGVNGVAHVDFHGSAVPDDVDLSRVWVNVAAHVWHTEPGWLELLARRLLRSPGLARALVTTPSLLLGWVLASAVVLITGVAVTQATGMPCFALLAPAVAAVGIAYAYGPGVDPAWELSCSLAVSDRMVLLVRASAVFGLNAAVGLIASAVVVQAKGLTFGWLVPMTAVSCLALAAATVTRSANVGSAIGLFCWGFTVLAGEAAGGGFGTAATDPVFFLPYLAVAVLSCAVVLYTTRIPKTGRPWTQGI